MNNTDFLEKMDLVDLDMVEHAAEKPLKKHVRWTYYASAGAIAMIVIVSMAACFGVFVMCGIFFALSDKTANTSGEVAEGVASMIGSTSMIWMLIGIIALAVAVIIAIIIIKKRNASGDN